MDPFAFEFEVMILDDQYGCNNWANSCKHLGLSVDELEVRKSLKTNMNVLLY
jgi:hypothetical protein